MDKYNRLFDLSRYKDETDVCFSINGDLEDNAYYLSESLCSRIIYLGKAYELHYLQLIDIYGDVKLNKTQVYSLIEELFFIQSVVNDTIIDHFVPSLIELLEKITLSQNEDTLWIMGN
ncbi:hypothetical protein [Alkalihalobacillus deserti]|uniref:hypothetical protein n=1 Tax=Alkalihalobacillus deserti TaxID=2879466 RepID=UPI001D148A68|nr:hypothetical protein [Alkalihalobacillus deserti]